ncbi:MAG: hypothetical protein BIFFINMI_00636 [Phycisphaerae bacterium]|nr:hypothetical protein [Phycisphaerae bacterium]
MSGMFTAWGSRGVADAGEITFRIKSLFFDRNVVKRSVDKATLVNLRKAGGLIMRIARNSMRYVTEPKPGSTRVRPVSSPGEPPRAIRPHPWLRKNLFFAFNPGNRGVVVGPVGFGTRGNHVPSTLEFGGRTYWRNKRRRIRRIGSGGEVRIGGAVSRTTKPVADQHGSQVMVTYARLITDAMVERANRLNEELYGPAAKVVFIEPRPFMGPALAKAAPDIPKMWARSVRAG